jgi:hypothetical protein
MTTRTSGRGGRLTTLGTAALAALALGAGLAPQRAAAAAPEPQMIELSVEITGMHLVDWQYRSDHYDDPTVGWTEGSGNQTLGWSTTRPLRAQLMKLPASVMGHRLPPLQLVGFRQLPRLKGTVVRTARVRRLDPPPVCEGGDVSSCGVMPLPRLQAQVCGRRPVKTGVELELRAGTIVVRAQPATPIKSLFPRCAPDRPDQPFVAQLDVPTPDPVYFWDAANAIAKLRRGGKLKLHEDRPGGARRCPLPKQTSNGYEECGVTDVTLEIRRVR